MLMSPDNYEFAAQIKAHLQRVSESLGKEFIVIGGWAVHAHGASQLSLAGDAMISVIANGVLRDEFIVTPNPRLGKQQYQADGFDVDLYVEHQHKLRVSFDEIQAHAVQREGMWVACPEHLLILKCGAISNRGATPKGAKDKRDLLSLLSVVAADPCREILDKHLLESDEESIRSAMQDADAILELAEGNSHLAKQLSRKFSQEWEGICELLRSNQTGQSV